MIGKGWTTNEVGLHWLKTKFTPWAKHRLQGSHILLIVDGHGSHVSLEFIDFCIKNQIVALCLPPHTIYILQLLDVGIFGPLSHKYKTLIEKKCQYGTGWSVDKTSFLQNYIEAQEKSMSQKNILSSWTTIGLIPYDPELVMVKKTLGTGLMKSLSSISPTLSNLTRHFSSASQISVPSMSSIPGISPFENSPSRAESNPSRSSYLQNFEEIDTIVQRLKDGTPRQDLRITQLAHRAKLRISQEVISSKVYNELLDSMWSENDKEKNTRKGVYKSRHLNVEEAEALCTREEEKKRDNLRKKNEVKARKLTLIAKAQEKEEKEKKKAAQKAILELEKAQKTTSKLDAKEKRERKKQDDMLRKVCAAELSGINPQVFQ